MLVTRQTTRRVAAALLAAVVVALATGCGEKDEPSLGELEQSARAVEAEQGAGGFEIEGEWRGELRQRGLRPFTLTATIADLDDPSQNPVRYTGIDCSGNWSFVGRDGRSYEFEEVIDRGEGGTCKGVGTVTLTPAGGDELDYRFRGGGVESEGVLERVG
jgi:hypothetical protein